MVRISDGRMSGTASGTVVLQVAPEASVGGPLALVKEGDIIALDLEKRSIKLEVSDEELAKRREAWVAPEINHERGFKQLFVEHVLQADEGLDFDFLRGNSGSAPSLRRPY